jgi:hypothetical protein
VVEAKAFGRKVLEEIVTIVTLDTLLHHRHRRLDPQKFRP